MSTLWKNPKLLFTFLAGLTLLMFLLNIMAGSVIIPISEIWEIVTGGSPSKITWEFIVLEFRIPKALTALLAGSAIAVSGLLMQTLFRNPLAGPFVLGISNGASLGVAVLLMAGGTFFGSLIASGNWAIIFAAILGSSSILFLVLLVSSKIKDNVSLLIIGLMVGSATGAVVSVLQFFSDPQTLQTYMVWTFGSLSGATWSQLIYLGPITLIGLLIAVFSQKNLNAFLLGEDYAKTLGINIRKQRFILIIATCLLAGGTTAFCGPIAFIGIAIPHLARALFRTSNHRILIPSSIFIGATVLLLCDGIAQLPGYQKTLPLNAVTAIFGSPVVIWIVIKSRGMKSAF